MNRLLIFPGQGAQRPGMLSDLPEHPAVRAVVAQAHSVLQAGEMDSARQLESTVWTQLCLLTAGVAMARCLQAHGARMDAVAGLSIGAYAAAVAAGVISFEDALRLVRLRGELMEGAYPHGYGMTAILGLEAGPLGKLVAQVRTDREPVYLANFNAPRQIVIAGKCSAMEAVAILALAAGAQAARPVAMSVPSHCPLLDEPARQLRLACNGIAAAPPRLRYLSASKVRELRDPSGILEDLAFNMATPVRWYETLHLASALGARVVVEAPPGNVLTRLAEPVFKDSLVVSSDRARMDSLIAQIVC